MDAAQIMSGAVALLGAGGGLTVIIKMMVDKSNGKPERERAVNADIKVQRDDAYELADSERERATREQRRADCAERGRALADTYAATLHRMLILTPGVDPDAIPPRPKFEE